MRHGWIVIRVGFLLALVGAGAVKADVAQDRKEVFGHLKELQDHYWQVKKFVETYGLEVVREKNFELKQSGSLQGSVEGKLDGAGSLTQLGNVSNLIVGLGQVGSQLKVPGATFPVPPDLGMMKAGLTNLLRGLNGHGWGDMKITGEMKGRIEGFFKGEGTGVAIHNEPSLFLIFARRKQLTKYGEYLRHALDQNPVNAAAVQNVLQQIESPLFVDEDVVKKLIAGRATVRGHIESLEKKLISYYEQKGPGGDDVKEVLNLTNKYENWFRTKRVVIVWAPSPGQIKLRQAQEVNNDIARKRLVVVDNPEDRVGEGKASRIFRIGSFKKDGYAYNLTGIVPIRESNLKDLLVKYLEHTGMHEYQVVAKQESFLKSLDSDQYLFGSEDDRFKHYGYKADTLLKLSSFYREQSEDIYYKSIVLFDGKVTPDFLTAETQVQREEFRLLPN